MSDATAYALAAMVCYGIGDFVYKRAAGAGIRADHFLVGQACSFAPLIVAYSLATHRLVPGVAALWGALAGIFVFIGFYNFARSLAKASVSTNASIFRLNFIVTALLAVVFLGEPVTSQKIVGLVLALIATWLLLGGRQPYDETGHRDHIALGQVLLAMFAFGTANFFHTVGLRNGALPETLIVAQAAVFLPLAVLFVFLVDRKLRIPPSTWRYGAAAAIVLLGAFIFLLRSVARGEASVMVPIAQMGFVVTAVLGIVLLREPLTIRKVSGLAAALAALSVLAVS
jgi:drug/metabolite transporter (DMT)-like permease